jgi:hypothetical protein
MTDEQAPGGAKPLGDLIAKLTQRVENALQKETDLLGGFVSPATDNAARTLLNAIQQYQKLADVAPAQAPERKGETLEELEARLTARLLDGA